MTDSVRRVAQEIIVKLQAISPAHRNMFYRVVEEGLREVMEEARKEGAKYSIEFVAWELKEAEMKAYARAAEVARTHIWHYGIVPMPIDNLYREQIAAAIEKLKEEK